MDIRDYLRAIRKYWWIVAIVTLVSAGVGAARTLTTAPLYKSDVRFYVDTPADGVLAAFQGDQFGRNRVNSYVQLFHSDKLAQLILSDSGLNLTTAQLIGEIKATTDSTTVLIDVTVTDPSPEQAQRIATSIGTTFPQLITGLETPKGALTSPVQVELVSGPDINHTPVAPDPVRNLEIAIALGLAFGLLLAITREALDKTVRSVELVQKLTGVANLGLVVNDAEARRRPVMQVGDTTSLRAESFRRLRTNLRFAAVPDPVTLLAVTSAVASEGKTSTAINLALSYVEAGRRVVVVDADLRRPRLGGYLGLENAPGLTEVLLGDVELEQAVRSWGGTRLQVLTSGSVPPNPAELLGSAPMADLFEKLRAAYDVVIFDSSPLLPVSDGSILAQAVDGVLLVVRHRSTSRAQVANAMRVLTAARARLLGSFFTFVPLHGADAITDDFGLVGANYGYFRAPTAAAAPPALHD